jgi:hypothetical protein
MRILELKLTETVVRSGGSERTFAETEVIDLTMLEANALPESHILFMTTLNLQSKMEKAKEQFLNFEID